MNYKSMVNADQGDQLDLSYHYVYKAASRSKVTPSNILSIASLNSCVDVEEKEEIAWDSKTKFK